MRAEADLTTKPLSKRHLAFVLAYIRHDSNAAQAYAEAYGRPVDGTARVNATKLLKRANIVAAIEAARREINTVTVVSTGIDKAWILERLRQNLERAMQIEPVIVEGKPTGVFRYDGNVANRALELMGRELGMFRERKDITVRRLRDLNLEEIDALLTESGDHAIEAEAVEISPVGGEGPEAEGDGVGGSEQG